MGVLDALLDRVGIARRRWTIDGEQPIAITRDAHGVPHVRAATDADLFRGLGHCHGVDRALQMLLVRIVAQGRASEVLEASDEMLRLDRFFRRLNLGAAAAEEIHKIDPATRTLAQAYCDGVNQALMEGAPWELRLLGCARAPWTLADVILISRVIGYVALAQSQGDVERVLVEMVQAEVPREHLEALFPGLLQDLDPALLRKVKLGERLVPETVAWSRLVPRAVASNNWALAGNKTASGHPILAGDPHLEVNRLPPIWYEAVLELDARFCITATMPGVPGLLLGRTNDLAWSATYTFMDAIDSWVEECREGRFRRLIDGAETWLPFHARSEVIRRKGKPAETVTFHENEHGVLDGDPGVPGHYLATRWSAGAGTGAASLAGSLAMLHAPDVEAGMALLGPIETAWNWVFADRHGNVGYQMSGLMPIRRAGARGLVPLAGWDPWNDWQGFVPHEELPRMLNPAEGFVVTANDDLNHLGEVQPINMPMGPYRAERIAAALARRDDWTVEDTQALQLDVVSPHAIAFMEIVRPLLPDNAQGATLAAWDGRYDLDSRGATLFERLYRALVLEVFGRVCGPEVVRHLIDETSLLADFYYAFDRVLLDAESIWFRPEGRAAIVRRVAAAALAESAPAWGEHQQIVMRHLLLGGRTPRWLGLDHGPIALPGGRATIRQGQVYRSGGRETSFAPSFRLVTDFGEDAAHTALAGGPSDRRLSPWYVSGVADWQAGRMKTVRPGMTAGEPA